MTPGATHCRGCGAPLDLTMVDLGKSPLCESFLSDHQLETLEPFYPLHVRVCRRCWLAQLPAMVAGEETSESTLTFRRTRTRGSNMRGFTSRRSSIDSTSPLRASSSK